MLWEIVETVIGEVRKALKQKIDASKAIWMSDVFVE
jgi:hypothetical protein